MANQEIWDYANSLGARMFLYLGLVELIIGLGAYFLYPDYTPTIALFAMLFGIGAGMYWCETQLNKRFDKKGNQK
ncbi:MAG: SdpI family protein [Maribacter sp.]|nr:SdpI family protein [Maribacter sp.]